MLFRGRISRSLDAKGRLMLPPDFRNTLVSRSEAGRVMLTTYDNCVVAYPLPDWLELENKINGVKNPPRHFRDFRRLVIGGAEEMSPDAQGRIRLSKGQLAYAGISDEVVLVGQGPRFELWQPARLDVALSGDFDDISESVQEGLDFSF